MATTHALVGAAAGVALAVLAPEHAPLVVATGLVGGIFPDLDLYSGHRRTLHFPVYYSVWAATMTFLAVVYATPLLVAIAAFAVGTAAHAVMDIFGGGLELRPWRGESDRAVYNHALGRWHAPRRLVRYDGAPEDFLLGLAVAGPVLLSVDGPLRSVVLTAVIGSSAGVRSPPGSVAHRRAGRDPRVLIRVHP